MIRSSPSAAWLPAKNAPAASAPGATAVKIESSSAIRSLPEMNPRMVSMLFAASVVVKAKVSAPPAPLSVSMPCLPSRMLAPLLPVSAFWNRLPVKLSAVVALSTAASSCSTSDSAPSV